MTLTYLEPVDVYIYSFLDDYGKRLKVVYANQRIEAEKNFLVGQGGKLAIKLTPIFLRLQKSF